MQRDMKIGMALGVALVGIVGALFFRREPEVSDDKTPPPLPKAEQLDREIAEKAKAPYIQGLEEFDAPTAPVPPPQNATGKPNAGVKSDKPSKDDAAKPREMAGAKSPAALEPIRATKPDTAAADATPAHNRDWEPTGPSGTSGKKAGETPRSNPAGSVTGTGRTHVIRPGDTLSGLAARYLGSSARFREIYEANRDQLRSADDVREGMTLKIPDSGKPREGQVIAETGDSVRTPSSQSGTKARSVSTRKAEAEVDDNEPPASAEPASDGARPKIRFVPVNRGAFSAGRSTVPEK